MQLRIANFGKTKMDDEFALFDIIICSKVIIIKGIIDWSLLGVSL